MKRTTLTLIAVCFSLFFVQAQELPQPSPKATVEQRIGLTDISIVYSRPGVKGRTIWGDLVPYDKVWRTGANKATAISFSTDVKVNGKAVSAGTYSIFSIPGKDEWTLIFNKNTELYGTGDYKEEEDALRIKTKPMAGPMIESMLFMFDRVNKNSAEVVMAWDKTRVMFEVEADPMVTAKANIDEAIKEAENGFRAYNNAARYYLDNNIDLEQALKWSKKSVAMEKRFWNVFVLSEALAANGQIKEAIKVAEESKKMSEEADYAPYVKRNEKNIEKWSAMK